MLAAAAAPAFVQASSLMPIYVPKTTMLTLWGDGLHDDSAALQAIFEGKDVVRRDGSILNRRPDGSFYLAKGTYAIGSPLVWTDQMNGSTIEDCHFVGLKKLDSFIEVKPRGPYRNAAHGRYWGSLA